MKRLFLDREKIHKWTRRVAAISAVIFIISLIGLLVGSALPVQVEEEVSQLSYMHSGRFDYLVYLKPSYLFGPEPQEPPEPPPNVQYPIALIEDEIDMSFKFDTNSTLLHSVKQGVKIEAVLKNGDLWQKAVELVPVTDKTGNFKVEFELDLDEINELFDTIDEETGIATRTREINIVATVGLGEGLESENLVQSLPIVLSGSTIEIGGELVKTVQDDSVGITTRGTFDYTIYLEENSLYKTDTLKPPKYTPYVTPEQKTLGVGPVIPFGLVERMDTSYYYSFQASRPIEVITEEITVTATLESPDIWSKTFILLPSTRQTGDFSIDFPVDIVYLNELLSAILSETGGAGEAHNLTINAFTRFTAETEFGVIDEVFTQTLSTELGGGTLTWNEELSLTQEGAITTTRIIPNDSRYLGLSAGGVKLTSLILGLIFLMLFIASLVLFNKFKPAELPMFEKEALAAGKKYSDRIAEASSQTPTAGEKIISLDSIDDLVKVADELGNPVIHQPPTAVEKRHIYYVIDGTTQYQYIITKQSKERRSNVRKSEWL
ncbi:MAG: hypothetical protein HQ588_04445 [Deltaproteobacteria bacterium]|nr:hypothetical protein [Deltaproteobacteria bacterium]